MVLSLFNLGGSYKWKDLAGNWHSGSPSDLTQCLEVQHDSGGLFSSGWEDVTPVECYDNIPTAYNGDSCIDYKWCDLDGIWHLGQPLDISNCLNVQGLTSAGWCDVTPVSCQGSIVPEHDYSGFLDCKWLDLNGLWHIGEPLNFDNCLNVQVLDTSGSWLDASPLNCFTNTATADPQDIFTDFKWCDLSGNWHIGYPTDLSNCFQILGSNGSGSWSDCTHAQIASNINIVTLDGVVNGNAGDDILKGYDGDEILTGGTGSDTLTGGFGFDSFNFDALDDSRINSSDLITDFTQGEDSINFSELGFTGIQEGEGSGTILGYSYDQSTDTTTIEDINSDFIVNLSGRIDLNEDDFNF